VERADRRVYSVRNGWADPGTTFDVEGKDIVIGMIQTLYNRDYGETAFAELTIIDEVHRIARSSQNASSNIHTANAGCDG
jgi:superfamily II DNA or RNA helicase